MKTNYQAHLASPQWQDIRADAAARSQGLCELCKAVAVETHHVKYPRGYANDSVDNVLHVCSTCHRRLHGMNKLVSDLQLRSVSVPTFKGRTWRVDIDAEGIVWAAWDSWCTVLLIPAPMRNRLMSLTLSKAQARERQTGQDLMRGNANGDSWFAWAAVEDGLNEWSVAARSRRDSFGKSVPLDENERLIAANYESLRYWGQKLQNDAISGRMQPPQGGNVVAMSDVQRVAYLVQEMAGLVLPKVTAHDVALANHDTRLKLVETVTARDPDQFIDVQSFLVERGIATNLLAGKSSMTLQQALGMRLRAASVKTGSKRRTRLDGCSVIAEVNTYRRLDLVRVLEEMREGR